MPLLRLTGLQGNVVLVSGEDLIVHEATPGAASMGCTLVQTAAGQVFVRETVEEVGRLIEVPHQI